MVFCGAGGVSRGRVWFRDTHLDRQVEGKTARAVRKRSVTAPARDTGNLLEVAFQPSAHQHPVCAFHLLPDGRQRVLTDVDPAELRMLFVQDRPGRAQVRCTAEDAVANLLTCP